MKQSIILIASLFFISLLSCNKNEILCKDERDINYLEDNKKCDRSATEAQFLSDWVFTRTIGSTAGEYLIRMQTTANEYTVRMVTTLGRPEIDYANYFDLSIKQNVATNATGSFTLTEVDFSTEITNFKFETNSPTTASISYTMNDTNYVDYGTREIPN